MYNLGFDIDEVICKTFDHIRNYLYNNFEFDFDPETVKTHDFDKHPMYEEQKDAFDALFKEFKNPNFFKECAADKAGVDIIKRLYRKGHRIYFISNRPQGTEKETIMWFKENKVPFHKVVHTGYNVGKGVYGRKLKLDFYIDDRSEDIDSMLEHKNKWSKGIFLFDKPWNRHYSNKRVGRLKDWDSVFKAIDIPRK
jgi:uncharacterized HAD superfamily protein